MAKKGKEPKPPEVEKPTPPEETPLGVYRQGEYELRTSVPFTVEIFRHGQACGQTKVMALDPDEAAQQVFDNLKDADIEATAQAQKELEAEKLN